MGISKRLKKIAELVTPGLSVADIGTDHGYVPVYLLKSGLIPKALAADISPGSLAKAEQNRLRYGLSECMECRISDGFSNIAPYEAECAVIAGMGGILMSRILTDGEETVKSLKELVLSPHRDADLVRRCVSDLGFEIVSDEIFADKKKSYVIIKALKK